MNILLGTLRERKDQARNTRTTVQENTVPVFRKEERENVLLELPAHTSH